MKLEIQNLSFTYNNLIIQNKEILHNISLTIEDNEIIGILGRSGSGKTTLIQHFNGLQKPSQGKIMIDGQDLWSGKYHLSEIRRRVGLAFQFPETQFFEEQVEKEIAFGPKNLSLTNSEVEERVRNAMHTVGLDFKKMRWRSPYHLSTGEKRRVALASVIAVQPELLVLDEPTAGLDIFGIKTFQQIVKKLHQKGHGIVIVSHNVDLLFKMVKRFIVLHQGKIIFDGNRERLFEINGKLVQWGIRPPRYFHYLAVINKYL